METKKKGETRSEYVPGVCNIGHAERRARRMSGWIGLGMTIALWVIFIAARTSQVWRLFIFLPAGLAASGFLQSVFHFCAGFGIRGVFNFGIEVGKTDTVIQAGFRRKDRRKALFILFLSMSAGAVAAAAAYLLKL